MSDLNEMMTRWRRSLESLSAAQIEELEDHLRAEMEQLRQHDLSEREAFTVAAMRCGRPSELSHEYANANLRGDWPRLRWMIVGSDTSLLNTITMTLGFMRSATFLFFAILFAFVVYRTTINPLSLLDGTPLLLVSVILLGGVAICAALLFPRLRCRKVEYPAVILNLIQVVLLLMIVTQNTVGYTSIVETCVWIAMFGAPTMAIAALIAQSAYDRATDRHAMHKPTP